MDINLTNEGSIVSVKIDGNIDLGGGDKLSEVLSSISLMDNVSHVTFDMSTVYTITSSGIGKLLNFFKHINSKNGSMEIDGVSDTLYDQFIDIHLDRIFPIKK